VARLEAQLFRLSKKADDKEDQSMHIRAQSYIKLRTLFKVRFCLCIYSGFGIVYN
jgi:hypothetical protein